MPRQQTWLYSTLCRWKYAWYPVWYTYNASCRYSHVSQCVFPVVAKSGSLYSHHLKSNLQPKVGKITLENIKSQKLFAHCVMNALHWVTEEWRILYPIFAPVSKLTIVKELALVRAVSFSSFYRVTCQIDKCIKFESTNAINVLLWKHIFWVYIAQRNKKIDDENIKFYSTLCAH